MKNVIHKSIPVVNVRFSASYTKSNELFDYFDKLKKEIIDGINNGNVISMRRNSYEK